MNALLSSFVLVALSEMGDKTQLLAFALASRFKRPAQVMAGIFLATILNHALASSVGSWISQQFSQRTLGMVLGATFIAFGVWTLKPDTYEGDERSSRLGPFLTTVVLFFLAEMGDKTQLATVALGARFHSAWLVTLGTTAGMLVSDGLAVYLGDRFSSRINMKWLRLAAAALFFVFGIASWVAALS